MAAFERQHAIAQTNAAHKLQGSSSHSTVHSEELYLPYSAEQLFDLVADIEHYPDYLPGWQSVSINKRDQDRLYVEQELGFPLFAFKIDSVAELDRPHHLSIVVEGGPFQRLQIDWYFQRISSSLTRVSLFIEMDVYPGPQQSILQQFLNYSTGSLLDYFEQRAKNTYQIKYSPVLSRLKGR